MANCTYCGRENVAKECGPNKDGYCKCCGITYTEPEPQEEKK